MLRVLALSTTLMFVTLGRADADAVRALGRTIETALQQSEGELGKAHGSRRRAAVVLDVESALAGAESAVRARSVPRGRAGEHSRRPVPGLLAIEGLDGGADAALRYPVSERMSLGLGYRFVTSEDLRFESAESAALESDYGGHSFVVRARWAF